MLDEAINELTKILIKQDLKDKEKNKIEYLTIKKTDLIKICIKMLKIIKNSLH